MKITSSIEYATRIMVALARAYGRAPVRADALAESERAPSDYVDQLLLRLRRAGLIVSHRGTGGGYSLSRPPAGVTIGAVARAVQGRIFEGVCSKYEAGEKDCRHQGGCSISPVWRRLSDLVERYCESVSLADILREGDVPGGPLAAFDTLPAGKS